jgi:hypothetical protein
MSAKNAKEVAGVGFERRRVGRMSKKKNLIRIFVGKGAKKKIAFRLLGKNEDTGCRAEVTVFQSEPQSDVDPRPEMLAAAKKCWQAISGDDAASNATKSLNEKGCDWFQVLALVEQYCRYPDSRLKEEHEARAIVSDYLSKKIRRFQSKIDKWERQIRDFNSEIKKLVPIDIDPHAPNFEAYLVALDVADRLSLPSARTPKIKSESIVYLYHLARLSTGSAHFRELADILRARLNAIDSRSLEDHSPIEDRSLQTTVKRLKQKKPHIDERLLQTTVKRFKRNNPKRYDELLRSAQFAIKWRPFSNQTFPTV